MKVTRTCSALVWGLVVSWALGAEVTTSEAGNRLIQLDTPEFTLVLSANRQEQGLFDLLPADLFPERGHLLSGALFVKAVPIPPQLGRQVLSFSQGELNQVVSWESQVLEVDLPTLKVRRFTVGRSGRPEELLTLLIYLPAAFDLFAPMTITFEGDTITTPILAEQAP
ncbi:MAG: hypothetical protein HY335_00600 [Deinococcus sp.]|nr:hypothetical protein [Deinococcus sp.]